MKRNISILMSAILILGILSSGFCASALSKSGSCGSGVKYTYNSKTGEVTISGKGNMKNYSAKAKSPFESNKSIKKVIVGKQIATVGARAFYNCTNLKKIAILNPKCKIYNAAGTISKTAVIYGKKNSTAQSYAKKYSRTFKDISKECIGHKYTSKVTKATMSANGKLVKTCSLCGKKVTTVIYKIASVKLSTTSYKYDGKAKTPAVTVKNSKGKVLKKGTDYTVAYASGRKAAGTYNVTVTFKGNYSGKKTLSFKIVKSTPTALTKSDMINLYITATGKGQNAKSFDKTRSTASSSKIPGAYKSSVEKFLGIGEKNAFKNVQDGKTFTYKDKDGAIRYLLKKSTLTASDVLSASYKTSGDNYVITMTVKNGSSSAGKNGANAKNNSPLDKTGICTGNRDIDIYDHKTAEICTKAGGSLIKSAEEATSNIKITATINKSTKRMSSLVIKFDITANIKAIMGTINANGTTTITYKNFKY